MSGRAIHPGSSEWQAPLDGLPDGERPSRLFAAGLPLRTGARAVAIVGSRRPTGTGLQVAREFARHFAEAGLPVVSGLAMGIDAAAHEAALEAGGYTVAVLGCGLDVDYPRRNLRLKRRIAERGTLLTEHGPGTGPLPGHFPARNRLIAALSDAVVFVEGSTRSGGIITARWGLDLNRHVFAVPGSVRNPLAGGPNELIRAGHAALVTSAQQVIEDIAPGLVWGEAAAGETSIGEPAVNPTEARVLLFLDDTPTPLETICTDLALAVGKAAIALAALEVRNFAVKGPGGYTVTSAGARVRSRLSLDDREPGAAHVS